jgi:hypothetical protein
MNLFRTLLGTALVGGVLTALPAAIPAATPAAQASVPECGPADLGVSFKTRGAAAGSLFGVLRYRNVSTHACRTGGYGGLSFVGHHDGRQIGAAAVRAPGTPVRSFVLHPGQRAVSKVQIAQTANYDKSLCRPKKVDGFRVYVPDAYVSDFVPYPTRACSRKVIKTFSPQLSHQALKKKH